MWENNEYKMFLSDNSVHEFERVMLTSGECRDLIPMIFIGETGGQVAYYDCGGFVPLSNYTVDKTEDALYIMEKVLLIVSHVVEYLIIPAKLTLSTDTIFFNPETGEIKIAYVPVNDKNADLKHNILSLIAELKAESNDSYKSYLDDLANLIYAGNHQIKDMINKLGLIRRELYLRTNAS